MFVLAAVGELERLPVRNHNAQPLLPRHRLETLKNRLYPLQNRVVTPSSSPNKTADVKENIVSLKDTTDLEERGRTTGHRMRLIEIRDRILLLETSKMLMMQKMLLLSLPLGRWKG